MESSITLIANPAAKRASERKIQKLLDLLHAEGREVDMYLTGKKGDAEETARDLAGKGAPFIIAAGGDGTFNEVINGIVNTSAKMAIIPMGTTNVLAKELGISEDIRDAAYVALKMRAHPVSVGSITFLRDPSAVTRYFCLMAGIGFDGEVVQSVNLLLKRYSGKGAYIVGGLKTLIRYSPQPLTFVVDGDTFRGYSAIVGNASRYGGNFKITPDARLIAPDFYVYIMEGKKRSDLLRYACGILAGKHLGFRDVTYRKAGSIRVEGAAPVQIDGDYAGQTPAMISVVPNALNLVY